MATITVILLLEAATVKYPSDSRRNSRSDRRGDSRSDSKSDSRSDSSGSGATTE